MVKENKFQSIGTPHEVQTSITYILLELLQYKYGTWFVVFKLRAKQEQLLIWIIKALHAFMYHYSVVCHAEFSFELPKIRTTSSIHTLKFLAYFLLLVLHESKFWRLLTWIPSSTTFVNTCSIGRGINSVAYCIMVFFSDGWYHYQQLYAYVHF